MFNAFKYSKQLEAAGFSQRQAEIQLQIIAEIVEDDLATKQDITLIRQDIALVRQDLGKDIKALEETMDHKMLKIEYRMTIKIGTIVTIVVGTFLTLSKLF